MNFADGGLFDAQPNVKSTRPVFKKPQNIEK